ncbi:MAG: acetate--CoA ligase family protein [Desulfurococcaceae archaeon]
MVSQPQSLNVVKETKSKLLEHEAFEILSKYNIPHPPYALARTPEEAGKVAAEIGFPVVLKIVSPDISHKTDVGGVILGVSGPEEAIKSAELIFKNVKERAPNARIEGVLVQKMAPKGLEVIVGGLVDPVFGITLMFGLGGVFTEVFKDVTFRVWPITIDDAVDMINEIKSSVVLKGFRGMPPVDIRSIADIIVKLGKILEDRPDIETADLNPVLAYPNGALAIDARFILKLS